MAVGRALLALTCVAASLACPRPAAAQTLDECVKAPTRACAFEAAVAAAAEVSERGLRVNLLGRIAAAQHRAGLAEAARVTFARAEADAQGLTGLDAEAAAAGLVAARAEFGETAQALAAVGELNNPASKASALGGLAIAAQGQGRTKEAEVFFASAVEAAGGASDAEKSSLLTRIAVVEARYGAKDAARTFDRAFEAAQASKITGVMNAVLARRAQAGQFVEAYLEAHSLPESSRDMVFLSLSRVEANAGRIDNAAKMLGELTFDFERIEALTTLAAAQFRGGRGLDAADSLLRAQNAAAAETMPDFAAVARAHLAGAEAVGNLAARSQADFVAAQAALAAQTDASKADRVRLALVLALARAARMRESGDMAASIANPGLRTAAMHLAIEDRKAANQIGDQLLAMSLLPQPAARATNLYELAEQLPR